VRAERVASNVSKDSRFGRNPPHYGIPRGHPAVTSYMGVPATTHDGQVVAALFFGHSKAGQFDAVKQKHALLFAGVAAEALAGAGSYQRDDVCRAESS